MIIAIDGPAASGKGTIARQIASVYGLHHLDTGLLYRAVAKTMLDAGYSPDDAERATEIAARLKAAPDAHLLDTTHLGIDAAFRAAVDIIEAVRAGRKRR